MHIAHFGGKGSYSHQVTQQAFSEDTLQGYPYVSDVVSAVCDRKATRGVIPLENKYRGLVTDSADALLDARGTVGVVQELVLPIHHCVGGLAEQKGMVREVRSHEQALGQCLPWIRAHHRDAQLVPTPTTEAAAAQIRMHHLEETVAIASEEALVANGLHVYHRDILPENVTRFGVLARIDDVSFSHASSPGMRTLIGIYLAQDVPGALDRIVHPLAQAGINMFQIYSRPNGQGGYHFFAEVGGTPFAGPLDTTLEIVARDFETNGSAVAVLGVYESRGWGQ